MRSLVKYAPLLVLGPVTGPMTALAIASFRAGRPVRAWLCIAAIVAFWVIAPSILALELDFLHRHPV